MDPHGLSDPLLSKESHSQKNPKPKRPSSENFQKPPEPPEPQYKDKNLSENENLPSLEDFSSSEDLSDDENLSSTTYWSKKKEEALKFLKDNKDDPSLELHCLAFEGKFKELEKMAEQEWTTVDAVLNHDKKYVSKGTKRWPFVKITENEKFVLVKQESIKVSLCRIKKCRRVHIGKPLEDLKLKMKKDAIGLTPLIYAIWGEQERLLERKKSSLSGKQGGSSNKTSSFIFYCNFQSYSPGNSKKIDKLIKNELAHVFIHTRLNEALDEIIIKDYSNLFKFIFQSFKEQGLVIENELKLEASLSLSINSKSNKCSKLMIEMILELLVASVESFQENSQCINNNSLSSQLISSLESYLNCIDLAIKFNLESLIDCFKDRYLNYLSSSIASIIIVKKDYSNLLKFIIDNQRFELSAECDKSLLLTSIDSKANKCIELIFEYVIQTIKESKVSNPSLLKIIENEIADYLTAPSFYLKEFLSLLTDETSKKLMENQRDLPKCKMIDDNAQKDDTFKSYFAKQEYMNVKIINSIIRLPGVSGSTKSINFLKQLEAADNLDLFKNKIIKYYILYKWKNLWRLIVFQDMLVLSNIPLLVIIIYLAKSQKTLEKYSYIIWEFIIINSFLAMLELVQLIALRPLDYFGIDSLESIHTLAFFRVIVLALKPLSIIIGIHDSVLFDHFELFIFFIYMIVSGIINSSALINKVLNCESISKDFFRFILFAFPSLICFNFWFLYDFFLYLSSLAVFIFLIIFGFLAQKNDDRYNKWRLCCSIIKIVFCIISLCLDNYIFQFYMIFEAINVGCFIPDISILWNKVKWQHILIDCILTITISFNFIYIEYYILRTLVTLICFFSLLIDYFYFDIDDIHFDDVELVYSWSILFLIGINPSNSFLQLIIAFILGVAQTAYWDREDRIYSMRFLYKSKQILNLNTIDLARLVLCAIWIHSILNMNHSVEITYVLTVLTCIRGLTAFRSFDGTRYYIRLILNSIKDISSFIIIFIYSTLCFGIISRVNLEKFEIEDIWIYSYYINLGEFRNENETLNLVYITFVVATVVNVIIMLNLLISILGDSFEKFQLSSLEIDYMEMASVVLEIESMMFFNRNAEDNGLFLVACDAEFNIRHKWDGKIVIIKRQLDEISKNMIDNKKFDENILKINEKIDQSIREVNEKITENNSVMLAAIKRIENLLIENESK